eukprot:13344390-Alexandrium_andersonii.AAC.1
MARARAQWEGHVLGRPGALGALAASPGAPPQAAENTKKNIASGVRSLNCADPGEAWRIQDPIH